MSSGPQHYAQAERLLRSAGTADNGGSAAERAAAQVHATLALAAATVDPLDDAWRSATKHKEVEL